MAITKWSIALGPVGRATSVGTARIPNTPQPLGQGRRATTRVMCDHIREVLRRREGNLPVSTQGGVSPARHGYPVQPAKDVIRLAGECLFPGWGSP